MLVHHCDRCDKVMPCEKNYVDFHVQHDRNHFSLHVSANIISDTNVLIKADVCEDCVRHLIITAVKEAMREELNVLP